MKELFFLVAPFLGAGGEQTTVESERGVPDTFLGGAFVFRTLVPLTFAALTILNCISKCCQVSYRVVYTSFWDSRHHPRKVASFFGEILDPEKYFEKRKGIFFSGSIRNAY
jgi:hypothetical protein